MNPLGTLTAGCNGVAAIRPLNLRKRKQIMNSHRK